MNPTDLETRTFIKTTGWAELMLTDARTVRRAIEAGQMPAPVESMGVVYDGPL